MASFAALMALSNAQTAQTSREVELRLKERERKAQAERKQQEERERREKELEEKIRLRHFEEQKREKERQERREQERLAKERERERREEEQRQSLLHGPRKAHGKDAGSRWPSAKRRNLDDDDDDDGEGASGAMALTRQEKRERKFQLELRRSAAASKRASGSSAARYGHRLPGGAIDMPSTAAALATSDAGGSLRARLAAMPNTLTKLNVNKRDTRTIDEILQDRARAKASQVLDGEEAREFNDWFGSKPKASTRPHSSVSPTVSGTSTPPVSKQPTAPSSSSFAFSAPIPRKSSSATAPSSKPLATPVNKSSKAAHSIKNSANSLTKREQDSRSAPANLSRSSVPSRTMPSSSKIVPTKYSANGSGRPSHSSHRKRPRSPSLSDSPSPPPPKRSQHRSQSSAPNDISAEIWKLFGKDRGAYVQRDVFSDDEDMEVDAREVEREEMRRFVSPSVSRTFHPKKPLFIVHAWPRRKILKRKLRRNGTKKRSEDASSNVNAGANADSGNKSVFCRSCPGLGSFTVISQTSRCTKMCVFSCIKSLSCFVVGRLPHTITFVFFHTTAIESSRIISRFLRTASSIPSTLIQPPQIYATFLGLVRRGGPHICIVYTYYDSCSRTHMTTRLCIWLVPAKIVNNVCMCETDGGQ